jgi:hypothetical protein
MGRHSPARRLKPMFGPIRPGSEEGVTFTFATLDGKALGVIEGRPESKHFRRYFIYLLGELIGSRVDYYEARRLLIETWEDSL